MMNPIIVNVDGSCRGNPGPGGWGVFIQYPTGTEDKFFGSEFQTTSNRMELTAALKALEKTELLSAVPITIISDSQYVRKGITEWIHSWLRNDWHTAKGHPVANVDLWKKLHAASLLRSVTWQWVKGHSGDFGNEMADKLANFGATGDPKYAV